jgi:tRNA(Arg) A34 adenosine deaminase TadA
MTEYLQRAIALAAENVRLRRGGPFGAVVVWAGEVVGEGVNLVTATPDPTAHAEIVALRQAALRRGTHLLSGCEVYTSCEPCPMCLAALYWARVDRVYYAATRADAASAGFDDEFLYEELALPLAERRLPLVQGHREDALKVFADWREDHAKVPY